METDGCTFAPELVTQKYGEQRNLAQFLDDQSRFLEAKNKKNADMKDQASKDDVSTMHPAIDETSKRIVEQNPERAAKPTYERLYELNRTQQDKNAQSQMNETSKANQTMTKERREQLDTTLYEDADRRKKDQDKKRKVFDKERATPAEAKYVNKRMDKYVLSRFNREFEEAL